MTQSYDKSPYAHRKWKKATRQHKTPPNTSITQRLWTDLGRLVGVTTAIQLVSLNHFMGTQPSLYLQKLCNGKDIERKC